MKDRIPDGVIQGGPFSKWELVVRDAFDLKELYKRLHELLVDEEFTDLSVGKNNFETLYREKDNGDGTKDHKIWWRASKFAKLDANHTIKFYIQLDIKTVRMQKKEVIINGQKMKKDQGEVEFKFNLYIDFNNNKEQTEVFKNHWLIKHFQYRFWSKWNRVPRDKAFGEAMKYSNLLYNLIQTYTGVAQYNPNQPRDHVIGTGVNLR